MNRKTIQRELADLVEKHIVQWVGSDKLGHWEVICLPNVPQDDNVNVIQNVADVVKDVAVNEADVVKGKTLNVSVNDGNVIKDVAKDVAKKSKKQ